LTIVPDEYKDHEVLARTVICRFQRVEGIFVNAIWSEMKKSEKLHKLFNPASVAVIGASENPAKLGFHVIKSLIKGGFKKKIIPVNPSAKSIWGLKTYGNISEFDGEIDMAIVVLPAMRVREVFEECERVEIKGIVLITAGFKEIDDPQGARLQLGLTEIAERAQIPVIGPNTFGIVNLGESLNASFTPEFSNLKKGGISLVSQSGGVSHLLGFMAMTQGIGFNKIIGLGNRLNLGFAEMVTYLMEDPDTSVIALYLEGLDHPRGLMEAVRSGGGKKPVVALKAGSASKGDRASLSHTGTMAGRHEIYQGGLTQVGIYTVQSTQELLDSAKALEKCSLPEGKRIAVLSGQAGPAMVACDICEKEGLEIVSFTSQTRQTIEKLLPPLALRTNPVDMGPAWYDSKALRGIVKVVMEDQNVDGIILLMMFASANREAIPNLSPLLLEWEQKKPLITCLIAPQGIWDEEISRLINAGALINFPTPESAAQAMASLWACKAAIKGRDEWT
jgi:acyl-CoA synthetase (NDP forming)